MRTIFPKRGSPSRNPYAHPLGLLPAAEPRPLVSHLARLPSPEARLLLKTLAADNRKEVVLGDGVECACCCGREPLRVAQPH
eukprot:162263-Chlamydomonas_euryale.AAC.5